MKVATKNTRKSPLARSASKTKVTKKSSTLEEAPFFKKKMAKANKILSLAPLPQ